MKLVSTGLASKWCSYTLPQESMHITVVIPMGASPGFRAG